MTIDLGVGLFWKDKTYDEYVALVKECEDLGYDYLWVANEKFFHDMYISATVCAEKTSHPKIGTFIADPYTQHPALTAMSIGTLDAVSGGRAVLGIGAGGTGFPPMGIKRTKPAQAIKESIHVIRELLQGATVDYQGEIISFRNGRLNFKPRSDIPIVVATRGNLVLQVGGEVADGVMVATYAEPVGVQHALSMVQQGAEKAGRSLDDLRIISRVDACICDDRRAAIDALKPMVGVFLWTSYPDREFVHKVGLQVPDDVEAIIAKRDYNLMVANAHLIPDVFVEKFCWAGTADEVAQQVAEVAKMGVDEITFLPHPPKGGDIMETIQQFATTVKPKVEEMLA